MEEITVAGERSTITIDPNDRFLNEEQILLGFRYHGSNSRTTTIMTDGDLDALMQAIIRYKREKAVETLERFKGE